jgi:hypothetical protein
LPELWKVIVRLSFFAVEGYMTCTVYVSPDPFRFIVVPVTVSGFTLLFVNDSEKSEAATLVTASLNLIVAVAVPGTFPQSRGPGLDNAQGRGGNPDSIM